MANKKLHEVTPAGSVLSTDLLLVETDPSGTPATRTATIAQVVAHAAGGTGAPGWVSVADYGAAGDCEDDDPTTGTDDAPAFEAALAAAYAADKRGIYIPPLAPGFSYRFDSRVLVTWPAHILGVAGAHRGTGTVRITLAAGAESAFTFVDGEFASPGPGAEGAVLEGVHIKCTPTAATVLYAAETAYTTGQFIKAKFNNRHLYKVLEGGTTADETELEVILAQDPHFSDRASEWQASETIHWGAARRSTDSAHWDVVFYATTPAEGAAGAVTGGAEPTWDYEEGETTVDGGVTWTCFDDPGSFQMGTVWAVPVHMSGIYVVCPMTVRDCYVESPQTAGIVCIGNASIPGPGSDTIGWEIIDTTIKLTLAGGESMGLWVRGGQNRFGLGQNVSVIGTGSSGQGAVSPLPTDKSQSEHGIHDETFLGGNRWIGCRVKYCKGYDFAATGTNNLSTFVGCVSDAGRIRLDASSWFGPEGSAGFWGASGLGYESQVPSAGNGLHGAVETYAGVRAGLNAAGLYHYIQDSTDGGSRGFQSSGAWLMYRYSSVISPAFAVANNSVADDGFCPNGELSGAMNLTRGFTIGYPGSAYLWEFPDVAAFRNPKFRGGYRIVGDATRRPDKVAVGGYERDVVVSAGWTGPAWTATTAVYERVAPVSVFALQASVVIPTDPDITDAFLCTVDGTTGGAEPDWTTAPDVNDTIADGTATWKNIGPQPKLAAAGTVDQTTVATVTTTGNIDDLPTEGIKEIRFTGMAPVIRGLKDGAANRELVLTAVGGPIVLNDQDANSGEANRFDLGATGTIAQKSCVRVRYDATTQRWREFSALART